jgi:hypothetical protein
MKTIHLILFILIEAIFVAMIAKEYSIYNQKKVIDI